MPLFGLSDSQTDTLLKDHGLIKQSNRRSKQMCVENPQMVIHKKASARTVAPIKHSIRKNILFSLLFVTPAGFLCKYYPGPGQWWVNNYFAGLIDPSAANTNFFRTVGVSDSHFVIFYFYFGFPPGTFDSTILVFT